MREGWGRRMPDGLVPTQVTVQVHSLLHTNLNTVDVSAAGAGYAVPSIDFVRLKAALHGRPWTDLAAWPVRGSATIAARTTDLDGVPIELIELAGGEAGAFSHLRINV